MTDLELIVDFYKHAPRQGPGSETETIRALELIDLSSNGELRIADIGCGTGSQTLALAKHLNGHITAVDLFPEFLDELNLKAQEEDLQSKITSLQASMEKLPFNEAQFDIIWSEGAIYNMGFEAGLRYWRQFLKTNGCLAVSEITWLTPERPNELEAYWKAEYPEIDTASAKFRILEENGYSPVGYFVLSTESWTTNFYLPLEARCTAFLSRHSGSRAAQAIVEGFEKEFELYKRYHDHYNYGFYVARKI